MAKGVKYYKTVEKGDILTASETTKIYELQDDGTLKHIDTNFKGDLIGFYTGGHFVLNGVQYLEILTSDAVLADGSIDFNRNRLYFQWDYADFAYTPNPNYYYPDRPGVVEKEMGIVTWVADNSTKLWLVVGGIVIGVAAYFIGKKRKTKVRK